MSRTWGNAWLDGEPTSVEEHERCWTPSSRGTRAPLRTLQSRTSNGKAPSSSALALGQRLERVFADLAVLARATTDILAAPGTSCTKLESLKPAVEDIVTRQAGLVDSPGLSVTPGLFTDADAGTSG